MSSLPNVAQTSSAARNASATHSTRRPSGLGGASCSRTIAGRKSRGSAWMRSPRRSARRAAAAIAEAALPGGRDVTIVSVIVTFLAQRDEPVLQRRERPQGLRLGAEARSGQHVLRLVEPHSGKGAVLPVLIGKIPAEGVSVASR